jgi:hypothetical protein
MRCIDALELLDILSTNSSSIEFHSLIRKLEIEDIQSIESLTIKRIVNGESTVILKKLMEISICLSTKELESAFTKNLSLLDSPTRANKDAVQKRIDTINNMCSGLFTVEENKNFIGLNLIRAAEKEGNKEKKVMLLKTAIEKISENP